MAFPALSVTKKFLNAKFLLYLFKKTGTWRLEQQMENGVWKEAPKDFGHELIRKENNKILSRLNNTS